MADFGISKQSHGLVALERDTEQFIKHFRGLNQWQDVLRKDCSLDYLKIKT
jgi:hypothetical protein